ncbi:MULTISPECIES: type VI secretion system-associated protein TagF [unclassified Pseudoalteromonas]|jgi:type VI secretion system protein ImpM|uniref:type VI secretion system-associated protein TagF n=1 Tax=unclassified Pseudoalteromonas TaxID=194690 RepID=UPI0015FFE2D4|nr:MULTISPECIES: type VI secretion system-associated protein TagF [unclassified Pseudoalteromonas]MBB1291507.1 type VI secretion system-associated protein TagF [Pseudoalteromonas sp. SR41-4]MBB1300175.1 type VI secretion system-associated protein TagF [Pseudoalteromonas sp. SR44-8]MBB1308015.1 type VI secretion system-associated protein TagF [Pseudoalteromonas sp. SR41-8]MBB1407834.1 type VI secretion system-associated protein TagF [Pseudoalteromonas sp. SG44-17]MBB1507384.1 type VI secretion |tara:strand:- start:21127 stop:22119 length:993 start_codon:yes stop_codon:yes gene_type:complete
MFNLFSKKKSPLLVKQFSYGYMGKTPVRPDFVKLNISSRESVAFDHWLQEGFAHLNRGRKANNVAVLNGVKSLFFVSGNSEDSSLLGILQPSKDSSGRFYPFSSFIHSGLDTYKRHPAFLFLYASHVIEHLIGVNDRIKEAPSIDAMAEQAHAYNKVADALKQQPNLNQELDKLRMIPMSVLWQHLQMNDVHKRAVLIEELSAVLKSIANRGCLRSQFGIRLPMPQFSHESALVAGFWLHLIASVVADHNWQPWFFYQLGCEDHAPSLTVFCRPVSASYFSSIWLNEDKSTQIIDLTNLPLSKVPSDYSINFADMDNVSVYDALRRWCKA